jgi:uncharacterized RDD family membrane protein YckC
VVTQRYGPLASYGRRLAAFLVDSAASALVARFFTRPPGQGYSLAVFTAFAVECFVLTALTGHSLGQRVLGLQVRRLDGKPVGLVRSAIRTALVLVLVPVFLVDREGRGLHDRAAGTVLVVPQRPS